MGKKLSDRIWAIAVVVLAVFLPCHLAMFCYVEGRDAGYVAGWNDSYDACEVDAVCFDGSHKHNTVSGVAEVNTTDPFVPIDDLFDD